MRAIVIDVFGGPDVLTWSEMTDPQPAPGEIVVNIVAASVNAADWKVRSGRSAPGPTLPHVLGRDFSGIVADRAPDALDFEIGDEVYGVCESTTEGAYAEKIAVAQTIVARKPTTLSHIETAAVALAGVTAAVSIEETLKVEAGEKVFIHGGAGGVGGMAIQIAKYLGAVVVTTARAANFDYVRGLGADEVIDYTREDFAQAIEDCDVCLDTVGGDDAQKCFMTLKPGGRAAFIASGPTPPKSDRPDVRSLRPLVARKRSTLDHLAKLCEDGVIQVPSIKVFDLRQARLAHELMQARAFRGKIVLRVRAEG